jgi:hypothetical protein
VKIKAIAAWTALSSLGLGLGAVGGATAQTALRPPAVPLVTFNPYLSVWSEADRLTDDTTRHWTHREQALDSLIRIDGKSFRLMGAEPKMVPALPQVGLKVLPTRSIYDFDNGHVHVTMTFMTAALPTDLNALARPLSYITWDVRSVDKAPHAVSLYDSVSSALAVNTTNQAVDWRRESMGSLTAMRAGTHTQKILGSSGDDHQLDWGYAYLVAPTAQAGTAMGSSRTLLDAFVTTGKLPADDTMMPRPVSDGNPTLAVTFDLGKVGATAVSRHAMVGYDEIYSILYFRRKLRPYWRRNGATPASMFQEAERDYPTLARRCEAFDRELMADMTKAGGSKYAQITALSYRECVAACGLAADTNGQPLFFTKENTSNGDIATVDVIFPMDPIWVFLSPSLAKASLVPIFAYAASDHWKFPNAPHDLGTYPIARGTDDGGEGMPVEESGNMLILCDAIAQAEGNPEFVAKWWPQLTQWAEYLEKYGLDPEDQLCTDDFMGHLAHNANLSVKAILGLAAYGDLCRMRGDAKNAAKYLTEARADARHWIEVTEDNGHSRLAFDKPNTWSQKYNLVWDQILGLHVFPPSVAKQEIDYYKSMMQRYGVPLDSRTRLTKTDWSFWSATLADNRADFEALIAPIYDYLNTTTAHMPLVDSYITDNVRSDGMHARPVVGGLFIKMLDDRAMWNKWARRDKEKVGPWTELPPKPQVTTVVPAADTAPALWRYTTIKPANGWTQPGFDASGWKEGLGGFGNNGSHHTDWTTGDIWIRRQITLPSGKFSNLQFYVFHDEDVEIYIDGVEAAHEEGYVTSYVPMEMSAAGRAMLKPGATVTIAAHCHQTVGGQGIDIGIVDVKER